MIRLFISLFFNVLFINSCNIGYRKIPKISPEAYIIQRPILRGLSTEGILRFEIDSARLIVGSKFTVFALFYFVFGGNFPTTSPRGAYIWRGNLTGVIVIIYIIIITITKLSNLIGFQLP